MQTHYMSHETRSANRLIRLLPQSEQERIFADSSITSFSLLKKLFGNDQVVDAVYFPLDCVVSLLVGPGNQKEIEMAMIGKEGAVGAYSILNENRTLGDYIVMVAGDALRLPLGKFYQYLSEKGQFHDLMHRYLFTLTHQIVQAGACHRMHTMEQRCARWLLMMLDRVDEVSFPMTQEFLAEMLGVRRATVNAALGELKIAGIIEFARGRITVKDRERLVCASCVCYDLIQKRYKDMLQG